MTTNLVTKLNMFDGIVVTNVENHFSEMHFMQLSLYKIKTNE